MSEITAIILASFIGAFFGGLVTQATMFWVNERRASAERRRMVVEFLAIEYMRKADDGTASKEVMAEVIEIVNDLSDIEVSAYLGIAKAVAF